jgi:hypothetical protein
LPIVRPLSWFAIAGSVAVLLLGTRALARRPRLPTIPPAVSTPPPPVRAPPRLRAPVPPPPVERPPRPEAEGLAHIRGQVLGPDGALSPEAIKGLRVVADDDEHQYRAHVGEDGSFELHLPARPYTLKAMTGDLIGRTDVRPHAGARTQTAIHLVPGATIEVSLHFPPDREDNSAVVQISRTGGHHMRTTNERLEEGQLTVTGLFPGDAHELSIEVNGLRRFEAHGVIAPAHLEATLTARPLLHGTIGYPDGGRCPFTSVEAVANGDRKSADVDVNCRFEVAVPDEGEVALATESDGWHLEARVTLPAPPLVCLNPPCRPHPAVQTAQLEVRLEDAPAEASFTVSAQVVAGNRTGQCYAQPGEACLIEELPPEEATVELEGRECGELSRRVSLHPGLNQLTLPCRWRRPISGVIRGTDGTEAVVVRCPGGAMTRADSFVFGLRCAGDVAELQYRRDGEHDWHHAPIPPGRAPLFVELTL